jgi:hypothetical protein
VQVLPNNGKAHWRKVRTWTGSACWDFDFDDRNKTFKETGHKYRAKTNVSLNQPHFSVFLRFTFSSVNYIR